LAWGKDCFRKALSSALLAGIDIPYPKSFYIFSFFLTNSCIDQ
jgi:hypothetical protein